MGASFYNGYFWTNDYYSTGSTLKTHSKVSLDTNPLHETKRLTVSYVACRANDSYTKSKGCAHRIEGKGGYSNSPVGSQSVQ